MQNSANFIATVVRVRSICVHLSPARMKTTWFFNFQSQPTLMNLQTLVLYKGFRQNECKLIPKRPPRIIHG